MLQHNVNSRNVNNLCLQKACIKLQVMQCNIQYAHKLMIGPTGLKMTDFLQITVLFSPLLLTYYFVCSHGSLHACVSTYFH